MTTNVTVLVDALLNRAAREHPGIEYSIVMAEHHTQLLPKHRTALRREANGHDGQYSGHVYQDSMVVGFPDFDENLIFASPVVGTFPEAAKATTYVGDLQTGQITAQR